MGLFFVFFLERFEKVAMGTETVLAGDRVFKDNLLKWHEGEGHIGAKEDEGADGRKISGKERKWWQIDDGEESELSKNNSSEKSKDIEWEDRFLGNPGVGVEDQRNEKSENSKGSKFGGEIIGVFAIEIAIDE